MAANVFYVIIPSQKNMVNAALENKKPNLKKGLAAKTRSIHNNYLTLPVLFIMISSHFPFTYGHKFNWLILVIISIIAVIAINVGRAAISNQRLYLYLYVYMSISL